LATQAPAAHFVAVTTVPPLFGGAMGGVCFAMPAVEPGATALPVEPGVGLPPIELCFVTLPTTGPGGFVTLPTEPCFAAPPITGLGFAAPPTVLCFGFVAPPTAFWAEEGWEKPIANAPRNIPSSITVTIALFFMDASLCVLPVCRAANGKSTQPRDCLAPHFIQGCGNVKARVARGVPGGPFHSTWALIVI
jgi:hypothetical protein